MYTVNDGYTVLVSEDKQKARQLLEKNRDIIKPLIKEFNGEWHKDTLSSFPNPSDAVHCALEIQKTLKNDLELNLRIGIHTGHDVFGEADGVKVASGIGPLAAPGGICISDQVFYAVRNQTGVEANYLEEKTLENVDRPIKVYALNISKESEAISESPKEKSKPSIAVLPFIDMSPEKDQEYFCDGITEEIINTLAHVEDLKIISRTSAFAFKGKQEDIREIGKKLDVENLVEGSVRKAGNRLRITAQFVKVIDGSHLWSQQYDRNMEDIFEIQSDVAVIIVEALKSKLSISEKKQIESIPTDDIRAYDYFLRGNDYSSRSYGEQNLRIAIQMYEKAVEYDQDFALAYVKLGIHQGFLYWFHYERSKQQLESAKETIEKSLRLNPDLPEGHSGMGFISLLESDYENALEKCNHALRKSPNNVFLLNLLGVVYRGIGNFEQAESHLKKAIKLDPLNHLYFVELGLTYLSYSECPEAETCFNRAITLAPDNPLLYCGKAMTYMLWHGDTEKARESLKKAGHIYTAAYCMFTGFCDYPIDVYEENYQEALEELSNIAVDTFEFNYYFITKNQLQAKIYGLLGYVPKEQEQYNSARGILEDKVQEYPDEARFHGSLSLIYAGLGRKDEAIKEAKLAIKFNPFGKIKNSILPRVYVMVGEYNKAVDALEDVLDSLSFVSVPLINIHPDFKPLHNNTRFQHLIQKGKVNKN